MRSDGKEDAGVMVDLHGLGLLTLRVVVGLVFVTHGGHKLFVRGVPNVMGFLNELGITPPELWAWVLTLSELAGGLALILGTLTRIAALLTTATMVVAIGEVLWARGFFLPGYEFALTLLGASIALALTGPGRYAIDAWLGLEERVDVEHT
jgi:putative oxidoreductase